MNIDLTGRVAVVTGGYGAIGGAMCEYYVKSNAAVAVIGRSSEKGQEFEKHLREMGGNAKFYYGDVSDGTCMEQVAADVISDFGKIDILVNNAGVNVGLEGRKPIHEFSDENWARIVNTDLNGVYYTSKPIIRNMIKNGYGRIINIASINGEIALRYQCAFPAAKAAVINFTKSMAIELAEFGILVNAICPGSILFEGTRELFYADKERAERMMSHIPLGRPGAPKEIAGMTIMLSSDEITYMTGDVVTIDGGWICGFANS